MGEPWDGDPTRGEDEIADGAPAAPGSEGETRTRLEQDPGDAPTRAEAYPDAAPVPPPKTARGAQDQLPADLAARFDIVDELSTPDADAAVFAVRRDDGTHLVLKRYLAGGGPASAVVKPLLEVTARHRHLVTVEEVGTDAEGVTYEVMERLLGRDLPTLVAAELKEGRDLRRDEARIRVLVAHLTDAIADLHGAGIRHGDVKLDNVLVRTREPLEVALADYGLCRDTNGPGRVRPGAGGTDGYEPPELLLGHVDSPARDWWALGITLIRLITGTSPTAGLDPQALTAGFSEGEELPLHALTAAVGNSVYELCRGLLTTRVRDRWAAAEIRDWLDPTWADRHTVPAAVGPPDPRVADTPFEVEDGVLVWSRAELGVALGSRWDWSAGRFLTAPGPEWDRLEAWLRRFDDPDRDDVARRDEVIALVTARATPPDLLLTRLLMWLLPGSVTYRSEPLDVERLPVVAQDASSFDPPAGVRQVVAGLWRDQVLVSVPGAHRAADLAAADARWREQHRRWQTIQARLVAARPQLAARLPAADETGLLSYLLWLATAEQSATRALRREARAFRQQFAVPVGWYDQLIRGGSPLELLTAVLVAGPAAEEAEATADEQERRRIEVEVERQHRAELFRRDAIDEWFRRQERPLAFGWAVVGLAVVVVAWAVLISAADALPVAADGFVDLAWAFATLTTIVIAGAEAWIVAIIGGPYHSRFSLAGLLIDSGGRLGDAIRRVGARIGSLAIALGLAALVGITVVLPWVLPLGAAIAHVWWTRRRHCRWIADRAERARQLQLARAERDLAARSDAVEEGSS